MFVCARACECVRVCFKRIPEKSAAMLCIDVVGQHCSAGSLGALTKPADQTLDTCNSGHMSWFTTYKTYMGQSRSE